MDTPRKESKGCTATTNVIDELGLELLIKGDMESGDKLGFTLKTKRGDLFEVECIGPMNIEQYAEMVAHARTEGVYMFPYQVADRRICLKLSEIMGVTMYLATERFRGLSRQLVQLKQTIDRGKKASKDFLVITPAPRGKSGTYHTELQELAAGLDTTPEALPEKARAMAAEYNSLVRQEFAKRGKKIDDVIKPLPPDYYPMMTANFRSMFGFGRVWLERGVFESEPGAIP